jgi:DNA modification methylase
MDVGQAKTRFFRRNSEKADELTLHPHKEREFWMWVNSWGLFLQKPSDLGHSDEGYELPPVDIRWHEIPTNHDGAGAERDGQKRMFRNAAIGVVDAAREKRDSLEPRLAKLLELRAEDPDAHVLIWHDLEAERSAIEAAIPSVTSVYGTQDLDEREAAIIAFSDGRVQELAAKPVLAGSGCNFQRFCSWAIFLGIGFKFNDLIQAIHRIQRFLQIYPVRIDLIYTEAEREVRRVLLEKWERHDELVSQMTGIIREFKLNQEAIAGGLKRSMGIERREVTGPGYRLVNNDCVEEAYRTESSSVDFGLTSIPFSNQYEYSPSYNDFGHSDDERHFWRQMDFLTPELLRIHKPGRVYAVHVKDRITPGGINGYGFQTLSRFSDRCAEHFESHGWAFLGRKTVVTDVVRENNSTYRLGWSEQCKDGSRMGCGVPEYVLLFRKPPTDRANGYADEPVVKQKPLCDDSGEPLLFNKKTNWRKPIPGTGYTRALWQFDAHGFTRSSGDRLLSSEELRSLPADVIYKLWRHRSTGAVYDFPGHLAIAEELDHLERLPASFMLLPPHSWHPDVWADVARMRTLNCNQAAKGREMHLCPLQFDICDRLITQFSMPGEVVGDFFGGIGTVAQRALLLGRRAFLVELNPGYFDDAAFYSETAAQSMAVGSLFDVLEVETEEGSALDLEVAS